MAFFSLVFVAHFALVIIKGLAENSLENLKISHRNARARSLMFSIYQSYCRSLLLWCVWTCVLKIWSIPRSPHFQILIDLSLSLKQPHVDLMSEDQLLYFSGCPCCCWAALAKNKPHLSFLLPAKVGWRLPWYPLPPQLPESAQSCIWQYFLHEILFFSLPHSEPVNRPSNFHLFFCSVRDAV